MPISERFAADQRRSYRLDAMMQAGRQAGRTEIADGPLDLPENADQLQCRNLLNTLRKFNAAVV